MRNDDNLFRIVEAVQTKAILDADVSTALGIGLKLFSRVAPRSRCNPLFAPLLEPTQDFIRVVKVLAPGGPIEPLSTNRSDETIEEPV